LISGHKLKVTQNEVLEQSRFAGARRRNDPLMFKAGFFRDGERMARRAGIRGDMEDDC
jgi:hypothetical protein